MDGGKNTRTLADRLMEVYRPVPVLFGGHAGSINFCVDKTLLLSPAKAEEASSQACNGRDIKSQLDPQTMRNTPPYIHMSYRDTTPKLKQKTMEMDEGKVGAQAGARGTGTCAIYFNSFQCTADEGSYLSGLYR